MCAINKGPNSPKSGARIGNVGCKGAAAVNSLDALGSARTNAERNQKGASVWTAGPRKDGSLIPTNDPRHVSVGHLAVQLWQAALDDIGRLSKTPSSFLAVC